MSMRPHAPAAALGVFVTLAVAPAPVTAIAPVQATGRAAAGDPRLADAAQRRDLDEVRALLAEGAAVDAPQADGATALAVARHGEALPLLATLVEKNPRHRLAHDLLALCWMHTDERADHRLNLALCLEGRGALTDALAEIEQARAMRPGEPSIEEAYARMRR